MSLACRPVQSRASGSVRVPEIMRCVAVGSAIYQHRDTGNVPIPRSSDQQAIEGLGLPTRAFGRLNWERWKVSGRMVRSSNGCGRRGRESAKTKQHGMVWWVASPVAGADLRCSRNLRFMA